MGLNLLAKINKVLNVRAVAIILSMGMNCFADTTPPVQHGIPLAEPNPNTSNFQLSWTPSNLENFGRLYTADCPRNILLTKLGSLSIIEMIKETRMF